MTCVLCTTAGIGCFSPPPEAVERLERLQQDGRADVERWEHLEERMLGNQAKLHMWQEMARRHQEVSALACSSMASHVTAMEEHQEKQATKARRKRWARNTPASRSTMAARAAQSAPTQF